MTRSAAEMDALRPVTPTKVVVRALPFHCTTEHGNRLLLLSSFTVSINPAAPPFAETGESDVIVGTGRVDGGVSVAGETIENGIEFEVTVGLLETVMFTAPRDAVSADEIVAVNCAALTNVVGRGEPFQLTTAPLGNPVPLTVRIRPLELQYGVDADPVVEAESEVMAGATTGNATPLDAPPPPPEVMLNTVTVGDPTEARSVAGIAALSCVELT